MIYFKTGHSFSLLGSIDYLDIFSFNTQLNLIVLVDGRREFNAFCNISIFAACLMILYSDIFSN